MDTNEYRAGKRVVTQEHKVCAVCGKVFYRHGNAKYCSGGKGSCEYKSKVMKRNGLL